MRTAIISIVIGLIAAMTIIAVVLIGGANTREQTLENDMSDALKNVLVEVLSGEIDDEEEMKGAIIGNIVETIGDENSSLNVKILELDIEKGLACVQVTKTYEPSANDQSGNKESTVSCTRCVIVNRTNEEASETLYTVDFYASPKSVNSTIKYQSVTVEEGTCIPTSLLSGVADFAGVESVSWKCSDGNVYTTEELSELEVDKNLTFTLVQ
ncbi:hypothetical protein [Eubacterium oxidoreducens]|uniref:Uncharacterized protein n=1 Tax=Eubacterium oxidoreducens TaxID=1732 RepID=A0A1G6B412_EUBOX|nr:hypothetical protein [Eubacterium oxidoreducens]SDB15390.1 hypothetical protein SAMN02910417_01146 [Eubacterium oxidoreducens]